jgi:hypothetical protein
MSRNFREGFKYAIKSCFNRNKRGYSFSSTGTHRSPRLNRQTSQTQVTNNQIPMTSNLNFNGSISQDVILLTDAENV